MSDVATLSSRGTQSWSLDETIVPTCQLLTRDGERVLVGGAAGSLLLLDRYGTKLWRFVLQDRVSSLSCTGLPRFYLAGTWGGEVRAYVDEGVAWGRTTSGVVASLATSADADCAVAGTWAGEVTTYQLDGTPRGGARLNDAVTQLAIHPDGDLIFVALATGELVALELDGRERWRKRLGARVSCIEATSAELFAATVDGYFGWIDKQGTEVHNKQLPASPLRVAASYDGSYVAWIDQSNILHLWHSVRRSGWDVALDCEPDGLAIAGHGEGTFCNVMLSNGELATYNRYQVMRTTQLPSRIVSMSFSASGAIAVGHTRCGNVLFFLDITAVKDWLPSPNLTHQVNVDALTAGELGAVIIDITNEGGQPARDISIKVGGVHVRQAQTETLDILASGQTARVTKAIEPLRAGQVPINIVIRYCDDLDNDYEEQSETFVRVSSR